MIKLLMPHMMNILSIWISMLLYKIVKYWCGFIYSGGSVNKNTDIKIG